MSFDPDDHLPEHLETHPRARLLMRDASDGVWNPDVGPLRSDRGHDALVSFERWREEHASETLDHLVDEIVGGSSEGYEPEDLNLPTIERRLDENRGELDLYESIYTLDETVIATALWQFVIEGRIDPIVMPIVRLAVERQLRPLVLARLFPEEAARDDRARALREALRLLEASVHPSGGADAPRTKRRALKRAAKCPWPHGVVLERALPGGGVVLLHLFAIESNAPVFYVLDWDRTRGRPSAAELEALDAKPARNAWKFMLVLPAADKQEDASAYRARLEEKLVPTDMVKESRRAAIGYQVVHWANLDDHLENNWEWSP